MKGDVNCINIYKRLKTSRVEFSVAPKVEAKEPKKVALAYQ